MKQGLAWVCIGWVFAATAIAKPPPRDPYMAVVRQAAAARVSGKDTTVATDVKLGDVIGSEHTYVTGENGLIVLRFHPDFARVEARANTRYGLVYSRTDSTRVRKIALDEGQLILGVTKHSPPLQVDDVHSRVRASGNSRFSFLADSKSASTIVVLDGTLEVYNRSKDTKVDVRQGQKAVSDVDGLHISDATDTELGQVGLRQNILEVDFSNGDEFSTLEVEYEGN